MTPTVPDSEQSLHYGTATADMVRQAYEEGMQRGVLLMRHSARTFDRSIHDLLNPLTDHGRLLCRQFGEALPRALHLRGYASPPERCMETSQLVMAAHEAKGGSVGRTRPVEALGPFYALDQQRMWKGLMAAPDLAGYVGQWYDGEVAGDAMMPPLLAVRLILQVLAARLQAPGEAQQLDLCVSHDMTVYTVRHGVGLEPVSGPDVEFLDGLLLFERDGALCMRSQHGSEVDVQALMEG